MDKVTQGTAASAEEGASAAEELSAQADLLNTSVSELLLLVHGRGAAGARARTDEAGDQADAFVSEKAAPEPVVRARLRRPVLSPSARN
jgi:methyl-accepting chemotaxis protein